MVARHRRRRRALRRRRGASSASTCSAAATASPARTTSHSRASPWGTSCGRKRARSTNSVSNGSRSSIGGSLGGMQALKWVLDFPQRAAHAIAIGAHDHHSAMGIALNAVQREAIAIDRNQGLRLARKIAMLTYKSDDLFRLRHGRKTDRHGQLRYDVEGYLEYQADLFERRMDPAAYVALTHAMDSFDVRGALPASGSSRGSRSSESRRIGCFVPRTSAPQLNASPPAALTRTIWSSRVPTATTHFSPKLQPSQPFCDPSFHPDERHRRRSGGVSARTDAASRRQRPAGVRAGAAASAPPLRLRPAGPVAVCVPESGRDRSRA